ncbi:MAG: periplasmic heavy metal sensor [Pseudomonadales bacterium]
MTIALIVSITINLLFLGAFIGHRMWGPQKHRFPPHFGWMIQKLDEATREELKPIIEREAKRISPLHKEMREAQRQFNEALTSEPLDEEALDKAITEVRETSAAFQTAMHDKAMLIIKRMDIEEREKVAAYIRERAGHKHRSRE